MNSLLVLFCLLGFFATSYALECYVCDNQADNKDKCVKSTIQCREEHDTCLTRIVWRAPQFWTPRSEKMHHLYKSCNTSSVCSNEQRDIGLKCMRDWYRDWECVECCQGDRCNFYVTLGSSSTKYSLTVMAVSIILSLIFVNRFRGGRFG